MGASDEIDDDAGPVAAVAKALRYADKLRIGDLAHSVDEGRVGFAREVLARAAVVALRDAGYHLPRRPPEPGDARPDPDRPNDPTLREHLRAAVAFALGRVPRSWLRRMWADRNTDDVRAGPGWAPNDLSRRYDDCPATSAAVRQPL